MLVERLTIMGKPHSTVHPMPLVLTVKVFRGLAGGVEDHDQYPNVEYQQCCASKNTGNEKCTFKFHTTVPLFDRSGLR